MESFAGEGAASAGGHHRATHRSCIRATQYRERAAAARTAGDHMALSALRAGRLERELRDGLAGALDVAAVGIPVAPEEGAEAAPFRDEMPAVLAVFRITPPPCAFMRGIAARHP